jgi:hypothetical protein
MTVAVTELNYRYSILKVKGNVDKKNIQKLLEERKLC